MRGELQSEHHRIQQVLLRKQIRLELTRHNENPYIKITKAKSGRPNLPPSSRSILMTSPATSDFKRDNEWVKTFFEKKNSKERFRLQTLPLSSTTYLNWKFSSKLFYVANHLALFYYLFLLHNKFQKLKKQLKTKIAT